MEPHVTNAKEETSMLGAAPNRRRRRSKESSSRGSRGQKDIEPLKGLCIEEIQSRTRRNIQSDLLVNDILVSFKLDTGAECNIVS